MRLALSAPRWSTTSFPLRLQRALAAALLISVPGVVGCSEPEESGSAGSASDAPAGTGALPSSSPSSGAGAPGQAAPAGASDLSTSPGYPEYQAAQTKAQDGNLPEALRLLAIAVQKDPSRWELHDALYKSHIRNSDFDAAVRALQQGLGAHPRRVDFWYNLGMLESRLGNYAQAYECYSRVVRLDPDMALGHFQLGYNQYQQGLLIVGALTVDHGRMNAALEGFQRAIECDPQLSDAHYYSGMAHLALQDHDAALAGFTRAIETGATRMGPFLEAADVHMKNDNIDEAERLYREAASIDVEWAQPYVGLGEIEERRGEYVAALRQFETALTINPEVASVHRGLASCYRRLGQEERASVAQARFEELSMREDQERKSRIATVASGRAESFYEMGVELHGQGRLDEARTAYLKALESKPDHSMALTQLGLFAQKAGEMEEAEVYFRKAFKANGENIRAYRLLKEIRGLTKEQELEEGPPPSTGPAASDAEAAPAGGAAGGTQE